MPPHIIHLSVATLILWCSRSYWRNKFSDRSFASAVHSWQTRIIDFLPSWHEAFVALMVLLVAPAALAETQADCAGREIAAGPARPIIASAQVSTRHLDRLAGATIATNMRVADSLATELGVDGLEAFETRTRVTIDVEGIEYEAFSLLDQDEQHFKGALLFSPVPTAIREQLALQQQELPWSVLTVESGSTQDSIRLGILGHGPPTEFRMSDAGVVETAPGRLQANISEGCVDCIKNLLWNAGCEAVAIILSCKTGIGCPGSIMAALIKMTIAETTSITCSQVSILSCAAQCTAPTITITPASNATLAPSTVQIRVSVSGGGSQLGNWAAVLKGAAVQYVSIRSGADGVYEWNAAPGTYRIVAGNIPGVNGFFPPVVGMPWIKSSSNVVITAPNVSPSANFTFTTSGLMASFTDMSTDADGTIISRSWNFGDGSTSTTTNPTKTYTSAGTRSVSLTVMDNGGKSNTIAKSVAVSQPSTCNGLSYAGSLSQGGASVQPNGTYYTSTRSGTHGSRLTGPSGTDFDLYLYRWNGSTWVVAASARSASSSEQITYSGTAGHYYWLVSAYRGSGQYSLCTQRP